jgi:AcrR family transcriptional regulator
MAGDVRQQRGEVTRTGILGVARRLFSDFGYHNTGIADIQAATGLTKGAFYHHFRAKQDLALAVLENVRADYERQLFEPAVAQPTPGRRLASVLDTIVQLNDRPEWRNCRLLVTLFAGVNPADGSLSHHVQALQEELLDRLTDMVAQAQASGEAAPGAPVVWAQLIMSTCLGMVLIGKTGAIQADSAEVIALLKQALFRSANAIETADAPQSRLVRQPEAAEYF